MSHLEPLICLVLSDLSQKVSTGLADAARSCQYRLSGLKSHEQKKDQSELGSYI